MSMAMAETNKPYRKLPGGGSLLLSYARLYRAEDHVLQVMSTGFSESYLRFYYRDIQGISLRKTHTGKIVNAVLGAVMLVFSSLLFVPGAEPAGYFLMGLFGIPLLVNVAFGPTCAAHIQTAVQRQKLTSLGRLRAARNTLRMLLPLIESAQGGALTEEELHRRLTYGPPPTSAGTDSHQASPVMSGVAAPPPVSPPPPPE